MLAGRHRRLGPVPGADDPQQLIIGGAGVPVIVPGGVLQERGQGGAAGRDVEGLAGGEPGRPARILPRESLCRAGHPRASPTGRHGADGGQHRGMPQPGQGFRGPSLLRGDLPGLGDQRGQLIVIQPGRRRVVRVFVLVRVTRILILGPRGQPGLIPVRTLRHLPPARRPEPGIVTGSRGHAGRVAIRPRVAGYRCFAHVLRSVRKNDPLIKHDNGIDAFKRADAPMGRGFPRPNLCS